MVSIIPFHVPGHSFVYYTSGTSKINKQGCGLIRKVHGNEVILCDLNLAHKFCVIILLPSQNALHSTDPS